MTPRLALCLSGEPRTWKHTVATMQRYFENFNVDIFIHVWNDVVDANTLDDMKKAYNPVQVFQESRPDYGAVKTEMAQRFPVSNAPFTYDMFHAIQSSTKGILAYAEEHGFTYDLIGRGRYDAVFDGVFPSELIEKLKDGNALIVPSNYTPVNVYNQPGCNDQFALGRPEAMRKYADTINHLYEAVMSTPLGRFYISNPSDAELKKLEAFRDDDGHVISFRPEHCLAVIMEGFGVVVHREALRVTLLRTADIGNPFDDLPQEITPDWEEHKRLRDAQLLAGLPDASGVHRGAGPKLPSANLG